MTTDKPKILFIEDDKPLAEAIGTLLQNEGYEVRSVRTVKAGVAALNRKFFDLIVLDWFTPDLNGDQFMKFVRANFPQTYVLVHSQDPHVNKECTALGADDFVLKEDGENLLLAVVRGLRTKRLKIAHELAERGQKKDDYELIGVSTSIEKIRGLITTAATNDLPVVLQGETGVGKEIVAVNIHRQSARSRHEFFPVNCGAIATELLESELFGHVARAFTGATKARVGYFEYANGGTILLDEISAMPQDLQVKLLRTLQERKIRRVGSNEETAVDVRIIAASNVSFDQLVHSGNLRGDLYFRLNVFTIDIPSLRERREDIPILAHHFIQKHADRHYKSQMSISDGAMSIFNQYDFPGNIRELENAVQRGMIMASQRGDQVICPEDLEIGGSLSTAEATESEHWFNLPLENAVKAFERRYFTRLLKKNGGSITQCAQEAGLNRQYLYQKFDALNIDYQEFRRKKEN